MKVLCHDYMTGEDDRGKMEECLKLQLEAKKIKSEACKLHVAHIIDTQRADIHADPLLNQVCTVDDQKLCADMEQGFREYEFSVFMIHIVF